MNSQFGSVRNLVARWQLIVEDEQHGKAKAQYGKGVLKNLGKSLTLEFGKRSKSVILTI